MKVMKIMTIAILLSAFSAIDSSAQAKFIYENDKIEQYPKVTWLKGVPIDKLNKDKIYLIELWATWCKPCINSMPHLSELHSKFKDNIVFIAQDVWEDDLDKVKDFIVKNEKMLDFNIGYAGAKSTSDFDKDLAAPTGTFGIPRTFIIQNNTLLWITDPRQLNEEILQMIVDHKFSIAAAEKLLEKH